MYMSPVELPFPRAHTFLQRREREWGGIERANQKMCEHDVGRVYFSWIVLLVLFTNTYI